MGWYRFGIDVVYFASKKRPGSSAEFYTLSFVTSFKYDNDSVFIANCYPYTYSDCEHFINKLQRKIPRTILKRSILTKSLAGNDLELLIITNFESTEEEIA